MEKMTSLETQVGQIFISDRRLSKSFVSLLSEKVPETNAEIFSLIEVPILNPAAWVEYEKLSKALQTILRKNFRRDNTNAFENSIAQINDELAKNAAEGQTAWVGKMNGCLAVRQGDNLFVSTTGKIHAYLFRDKQLADIADSPTKANPLKTFENFAVGKVLRKDFLIFTTTQLFNYISVERLKDIIAHAPLATACQNIAEIIRNLSDESISFGTFILELGAPKEFPVENILKFSLPIEAKSLPSFKMGAFKLPPFQQYLSVITNWVKNFKAPKINLKDVSPMLLKERAKNLADIEKIKNLPRAKKFFLASACLLLLVLIVNIFVAVHVSSAKKQQAKIDGIFTDVRSKIDDANSAYIYKDKNRSIELLNQAQQELDSIDQKNVKPQSSNLDKKNQLTEEVQSLLGSIGGVRSVNATELLNFNFSADGLKAIGNKLYLIDKQGGKISPVDSQNKTIGAEFSVNGSISAINNAGEFLYYSDSQGAIYQIDNFSTSRQAGQTTSTKSLIFYGSPLKAYALNTNDNALTVTQVNSAGSQNTYFKQSSDVSNALDIAIDGSVYILFPDKIKKFTSGNEKPFSAPALTYSKNSRIYADNSWKYIYIMDPDAKKIVVIDKTGGIKAQYTSTQFDNLKDIVIDEVSKNIFILNSSKILNFQLPI